LRREGFEVADLGADTPAISFADAATEADRLVAVLIGVTTPGRDSAVRKVVLTLQRAEIGAPILVGGHGISGRDHALSLRADGWTGHDAKRAVETVRALVEDAASSH
jgi:methanogenic corrinoid protein MtbC1